MKLIAWSLFSFCNVLVHNEAPTDDGGFYVTKHWKGGIIQ